LEIKIKNLQMLHKERGESKGKTNINRPSIIHKLEIPENIVDFKGIQQAKRKVCATVTYSRTDQWMGNEMKISKV
jgi:hypothetical protein